MLHKFKNVTILLVLFIVVLGCAGAPKVTVVSPSGARIPNPYYTAGTTDGSHMSFTWYYTREVGIEDLDKTVQLIPVHLDRNLSHTILRKKTHSLQMTLRVFNPKQEEYKIYITTNVKYSDGSEIRNHFLKGESFLEFREWEFPYPYNDRIKEMDSFVQIRRGNDIVLRTKKFSYKVN